MADIVRFVDNAPAVNNLPDFNEFRDRVVRYTQHNNNLLRSPWLTVTAGNKRPFSVISDSSVKGGVITNAASAKSHQTPTRPPSGNQELLVRRDNSRISPFANKKLRRSTARRPVNRIARTKYIGPWRTHVNMRRRRVAGRRSRYARW